jgi:hypothetical protein
MDFSSLPRFSDTGRPNEPPPEASDVAVPQPVLEVTCPLCGQRTNHIQAYEVPIVVFLFVYVIWGHGTVAGCPRCVRSSLWRQFWVSLPASNILFPIVGLLIFRQISASDESIVPVIPPEYHGLAGLEVQPAGEWSGQRSGRGLRLLVALGIVICVAVTVFIVLPLLVQ